MWVHLFITHFLLLLHISSTTEHHGEDTKTHSDATGSHSILQHQIYPAMASFKPHKHPAGHQPQPRSRCKDVHACPKAIKHRHNNHHKYKVTFPLARPSAANINDICHYHGQRRAHSYTQLPNTGFANLHRQIKAVDRMEMGYRNCCHMSSKEHRLACSLEVWKRELHHYCKMEKSVKTKQYHCCFKGNERYDCFENDARHHRYTGDIRQGRNRHSIAGGDAVPMLTMSLPNVIFPPGEPNRENIHNICSLRKIRQRHPPGTLPLTGYHDLTHRAKAIDQLEANYEKCCIAHNKLGCAHKQVRNSGRGSSPWRPSGG
ncbi:extracellular matrix protein 1 [Rhincodon typus]|uniref:extracellular matrix protein 1 n=1 Tax=Rhincodon typus TaxID=259920 RepID=UPI00203049C6|nr:extracellular matrix protein 1 [Rhincodon typus]